MALTQTTSFLAFSGILLTAFLRILPTVGVVVITRVGGMRGHSFTKSTAQAALFYVGFLPTLSLLGPFRTAFSPNIRAFIRYMGCHSFTETTALSTFSSILFAVGLEVFTVVIGIHTRYGCSHRRICRALHSSA